MLRREDFPTIPNAGPGMPCPFPVGSKVRRAGGLNPQGAVGEVVRVEPLFGDMQANWDVFVQWPREAEPWQFRVVPGGMTTLELLP